MGSRPVKITPEDASSYPRNILKKPEAGPKLSQNERFWNHQPSQEQTVMKGKHFLVARPDPPLSWSLSFIHTHTHTHTHSHTQHPAPPPKTRVLPSANYSGTSVARDARGTRAAATEVMKRGR